MAVPLKLESLRSEKVAQIFESRQRRGSNREPCGRKAEILQTAPTMPSVLGDFICIFKILFLFLTNFVIVIV